ncbi:hypothetical protein GCM10009663_16860 [Kitasatospora arboriphila]|uniref:Uncharacterized protein n=1 Tax=Kitasatospora arboriphila TaxID=258052 RepID=A0ABN1TEC3_9ACTN
MPLPPPTLCPLPPPALCLSRHPPCVPSRRPARSGRAAFSSRYLMEFEAPRRRLVFSSHRPETPADKWKGSDMENEKNLVLEILEEDDKEFEADFGPRQDVGH